MSSLVEESLELAQKLKYASIHPHEIGLDYFKSLMCDTMRLQAQWLEEFVNERKARQKDPTRGNVRPNHSG